MTRSRSGILTNNSAHDEQFTSEHVLDSPLPAFILDRMRAADLPSGKQDLGRPRTGQRGTRKTHKEPVPEDYGPGQQALFADDWTLWRELRDSNNTSVSHRVPRLSYCAEVPYRS